MVVNLGAYATEIIRAGIEAIPKGQIEAGLALNLKAHEIFRFVVLKPALKAIYPALTSQFILLMLSSSVVSVISADDLTSVAANLQSQTFRSFEIYIVVAAIYLALALSSRRCSAPSTGAPSTTPTAARPTMRTFGPNEFLFILEAARWTLALSLIAFVGGAVGGLLVALSRTSDIRWLRARSAAFIQCSRERRCCCSCS